MAVTYVMIAEKKVPEAALDKEVKPQVEAERGSCKRCSERLTQPRFHVARRRCRRTEDRPRPVASSVVARPDIHLDFQIHIAGDTKPDVIDQIFASMAKHLYPTA